MLDIEHAALAPRTPTTADPTNAVQSDHQSGQLWVDLELASESESLLRPVLFDQERADALELR